MSSGIYRVGQKVTPAEQWDFFEFTTGRRQHPRCMPQYGGEYTVSALGEQEDGTPALQLREFADARFERDAFRPLVDESVRSSVSFTTKTPVDA